MSEQRVKQLLEELKLEVGRTENIDAKAIELLGKFETGIHQLINAQMNEQDNTVLDDAIALEASFAVSHPLAEKVLRELVNSLSKLGI
ncbi:MAG: hypothetical protein COC19_03515 [SAR86 cluster bacterium]|uniref:DUF4404 family protein n=1 Tax=SAR86 cluster bacterium TaxID=2030880 RepID=A0A2A4MPL7_9GAMM|nr:MAG: hypothetical protein COC19_03515 [SAR86 cluster bacterium]